MSRSSQSLRTVPIRAAACIFAAFAAADAHGAKNKTALDFYNEGVAKFAEKELRDAETALVQAARANEERVQPAALYNLGHVRFLQGKDTLKGEGNRRQLLDNADATSVVAEEAIRHARGVVESEDVQELINAYMRGRVARKQLRTVRDETTRELDLIAAALQRWRRSVGDFRGAKELEPANEDAGFNADVVERHIKELLKFQKKVQQAQEANGKKREELRELMKQIGGKIPEDMKRGSDDEESDEDEEGKEPKDGKEPKPSEKQQQRIGGDREIHPDMLRLLKEKMPNRTMSIGQDGEQKGFGGDKPEDKKRKGRDY